jgi:hypothetical protein
MILYQGCMSVGGINNPRGKQGKMGVNILLWILHVINDHVR